MSDKPTYYCPHSKLSRVRCKPFEDRPFPMFLFFCRACGRTLVKKIVEVKTADGSALKEIRSTVPFEILPWRNIVHASKASDEALVLKGPFIELFDKPKENGSVSQ